MANLPQEVLAFWNANSHGFPALWYEYAPEGQYPPIAVFWADGFSREYANVGFKMDTYRYKFSLLGTDPVATYEAGFKAVAYLNAFEPSGHIQTNPTPEQFATPSETGQANVWEYNFTIEFTIQPSN